MKRIFHLLWRGLFPAWLCLAALAPRAAGGAERNGSAFEQANKLYEQGKFGEAAAAYEKMIGGGQASAAVYFNLGNACFKDGQLGRAIYSYRRAEWLKPRDPDVQANLLFARKVASGAVPEEVNYWHQFIGKLSLNEWTLFTLLAWWTWIGLLAAVLWQPRWRATVRSYLAPCGAAAVLLTWFTWAAAGERLRGNPGVVIAKEAVIRYGPVPESRSFYTLHDGGEVQVLDHKGDWLQVADSAQRIGWLRQAHVLLLSADLSSSPPAPARSVTLARE
jgi:tetratricopeptide (TPR) repeat protein